MLSTLREFKTNKNCYTIDAEKGKRVLVRVTFKYGNDDGLLSAPVFDMLLDDNHWRLLHLQMLIIVISMKQFTILK